MSLVTDSTNERTIHRESRGNGSAEGPAVSRGSNRSDRAVLCDPTTRAAGMGQPSPPLLLSRRHALLCCKGTYKLKSKQQAFLVTVNEHF